MAQTFTNEPYRVKHYWGVYGQYRLTLWLSVCVYVWTAKRANIASKRAVLKRLGKPFTFLKDPWLSGHRLKSPCPCVLVMSDGNLQDSIHFLHRHTDTQTHTFVYFYLKESIKIKRGKFFCFETCSLIWVQQLRLQNNSKNSIEGSAATMKIVTLLSSHAVGVRQSSEPLCEIPGRIRVYILMSSVVKHLKSIKRLTT